MRNVFSSQLMLFHFCLGAPKSMDWWWHRGCSGPVRMSEEGVLGIIHLLSAEVDLGVLLLVSDALDHNLFIVEEVIEDLLVLHDHTLNSGELLLLHEEGVAVVEHHVGFNFQQLLVIVVDLALVINGLLSLNLLGMDFFMVART